MKEFLKLICPITVLFAGCGSERTFVEENFRFAEKQTSNMFRTITDDTLVPRTTAKDGSLYSVEVEDWTSGFFAGSLWYLYEHNRQDEFRKAAEKWTALLEPLKSFTDHHDLGFMLYCSYGNGYRLTGEQAYKDIILQGANSLSTRFIPEAGVIKSWNYNKSWDGVREWWCPVIIDNMMNLEMLFFASEETGDKRFYDIAVTHSYSTLKNHVRDDFSSYHVVAYDPKTGDVIDRATSQGFSDESTWVRGQAWGIYGFTMVYRETGIDDFLNAAIRMADFFLDHPSMPEDMIPYWDLNAGDPDYIPEWKYDPYLFTNIPRDASAGAIICSALFELCDYADDARKERYFDSAVKMLHSLGSGDYRAKEGENNNFILMHSVGSIPHGVEIDVPLNYADYYFLEALHRYNRHLTK